MRGTLLLLLLFFSTSASTVFQTASPTTIHVYVALCDNANQGIVPVPAQLGKGDDAFNNLYWGALYGVKTFLKRKDSKWELVKTIKNPNSNVLEQILFKHKTDNSYLLAEAYKGIEIKRCISDFLTANCGKGTMDIEWKGQQLTFGGKASVLAYVGHDGLMEFDMDQTFTPENSQARKAIVLACFSKSYFGPYLKQTGSIPLLWTTGLMAPEAYTLEAALNAYVSGQDDLGVRQSAAEAYHNYQKCGINGAKRLLVTGW